MSFPDRFRRKRSNIASEQHFGIGERPRGARAIHLAAALFVFTPIAILTYKPILRGYSNWLIPSISNPAADIAVVLDYNLPRVEAAVELFNAEKVKGIYIDTPFEENVRKLSEEYRIPQSLVYWGGCGATTTYEQAIFFSRARKSEEFMSHQSIVIVTSPYHLRRAFWSFEHVLGEDSNIIVKSHAAKDSKLREKLDWWQYDHARRWVSSETQKNIFYRFRYGLLGKPNVDVPYSSFFDKKSASGSVDIKSQCKKSELTSQKGLVS